MIGETSTASGHSRSGAGHGRTRTGIRRARLGASLLALLAVAACAGTGTGDGDAATAAAQAPQDPVAAFAAGAQPGAETRILLADGQLAAVRLVRSYHAASGRECREVLVGTGPVQRSQLVCRGDTGWVAARPLLRGGGVGR